MNTLTLIAIIACNIIWAFLFIKLKEKDSKVEKERFREFVMAVKSKTIQQYAEVIPEDLPDEQDTDDEIVDMYQTDPKELLRAIKKQHESQ
jgi:hypothetical protein